MLAADHADTISQVDRPVNYYFEFFRLRRNEEEEGQFFEVPELGSGDGEALYSSAANEFG